MYGIIVTELGNINLLLIHCICIWYTLARTQQAGGQTDTYDRRYDSSGGGYDYITLVVVIASSFNLLLLD